MGPVSLLAPVAYMITYMISGNTHPGNRPSKSEDAGDARQDRYGRIPPSRVSGVAVPSHLTPLFCESVTQSCASLTVGRTQNLRVRRSGLTRGRDRASA